MALVLPVAVQLVPWERIVEAKIDLFKELASFSVIYWCSFSSFGLVVSFEDLALLLRFFSSSPFSRATSPTFMVSLERTYHPSLLSCVDHSHQTSIYVQVKMNLPSKNYCRVFVLAFCLQLSLARWSHGSQFPHLTWKSPKKPQKSELGNRRVPKFRLQLGFAGWGRCCSAVP